MVKLQCSNFRISSAIFSGVGIFGFLWLLLCNMQITTITGNLFIFVAVSCFSNGMSVCGD